MSKIHGSLRLRPTRIGFLISPAHMSDLRRVMQVCTCLWGGAYNRIIPVCEELPDYWKDRHPPPTNGIKVAQGYIAYRVPEKGRTH